jgi:YD repeat-containing protein
LLAEGNWSNVNSDGTPQTRSHNAQNQITSVSGATTPAYDSNGNLSTDEQGRTLIYDGWGRLVEVKQGSTTLARYSHDALGRRVSENSVARTLYYSADWQVLEEHDLEPAGADHLRTARDARGRLVPRCRGRGRSPAPGADPPRW